MGYTNNGWSSGFTKHDTWEEPTAFVQGRISVTSPITVSGTLNGPTSSLPVPYTGPVNYTLADSNGNTIPNTNNTVPYTSLPEPVGSLYTLTYTGMGPPNSTLTAINPCSQLIRGSCTAAFSGQTPLFALQFTTNPTAGFLMVAGTQSAGNGQTLHLTVAPGGSTPVSVSANASHANFTGGSIIGWSWSINGSQLFTSSSFGQSFSKGTYQISLVVTDSVGAISAPVTGSITVTESQPLGTGWPMNGYNGQRTNQSKAAGPSTLPQFSQLIVNAPAPLRLIDPDGSLVFFDGTYLYSYTNSGMPRWQVNIPVPYQGDDILIGPDGTIYSVSTNQVWAWNKDTGSAAWQTPITIPNSGNERGSTISDSSGNLYILTGASYVGPPEALTSTAQNGTVRWQATFYGRGYFSPLLSADQTLVYIYEYGCDYYCGHGYTHALDATTGHVVYTIGNLNLGVFAPWNILFATSFDGTSTPPTVMCTETLSSCPTAPGNGVRAIAGNNIAIGTLAPSSSTIGLSQQGTQIWSRSEVYGDLIADVAGNVFAVAPNTNDLVAINGASGAELWRQHFTSTPVAPLLGDDGCLYVSVGTSLMKACH